jgi:hypothetical protein
MNNTISFLRKVVEITGGLPFLISFLRFLISKAHKQLYFKKKNEILRVPNINNVFWAHVRKQKSKKRMLGMDKNFIMKVIYL